MIIFLFDVSFAKIVLIILLFDIF